MNRLEKTSNPFIPIILESLQSSSNKVEQKLLVDFLENKIDYQSKSIASFKEENSKLEKVEIPDINEYWNNYNKSNEKFSSSITDWVRPVIYDRKEKDIKNGDSLPPFNIKQLTPEEVSFNYFEPNYMTYFPNTNYPYLDDEPMWIMPTLNFDFAPKLLMVGSNPTSIMLTISYHDVNLGYDVNNSSGGFLFTNMVWGENSVSWYSKNASEQANISGNTYTYICIG